MKNKTKLVLGLSILTAAALTAGATGTFAWFTTNRKATATFQNITAKSVEGSLTVEMGSLTEQKDQLKDGRFVGTDETHLATTLATLNGSTSAMTDVSSQDGISFAHPNWTDKAGEGQGVNGIADVSNLEYGKKGYWTAYYVGLYNAGGKDAKVYLNKGSVVTAATAENADQDKKKAQQGKNDAAAQWTRVAINIAGDAAEGTTGTVPTALPTQANGTKVIQGTNGGTKYVAASDEAKTCTSTTAAPVALASGGDTLIDVPAATATNDYSKQELVTIKAGYTQYFTVSVWLEGTANDNQDAAIGGVVNVTLAFAAVTVAA